MMIKLTRVETLHIQKHTFLNAFFLFYSPLHTPLPIPVCSFISMVIWNINKCYLRSKRLHNKWAAWATGYEITRILWNWKYYHCYQQKNICSYSEQNKSSPHLRIRNFYTKIYFNTVFSCTHVFLKGADHIRLSDQYFICTPHVFCMSSPLKFLLFQDSWPIRCWVWIMKLPIKFY
jgi:hypothetical protein